MKDFDRGSKRKCTSCSTLFFDFNKAPISCPACGAELTSLLTNVSKRGRPPKSVKPNKEAEPTDDIKIEEIPVNWIHRKDSKLNIFIDTFNNC